MATSSATPESVADGHKTAARQFLQDAESEFAKGDMIQASEKGWGAVALAVKAAATLRGVGHHSHRELRMAAIDLRDDTGNPRITELFGLSENLRANCYEAWMRPSEVRGYLDDVREFVEILENLPPPSGDLRVRPIRARLFIRDREDWEGR